MKLKLNLLPFSEAWKQSDKKNFVKEYLTATERIGLVKGSSAEKIFNSVRHTMDDEDRSLDKGRKLFQCTSYDLLLNRFYNEPFGYVPSFLKGRLSYIPCEDYD